MNRSNKENFDDLKHDGYKEVASSRRDGGSYLESGSFDNDKVHKYSGNLFVNRPMSTAQDSFKNTPLIRSPSKEVLRSANGSHSKFERSPDLFNETGSNHNISSYTLNSSAEKQLNHSRATVSFRQSINVDNLINICTKKLENEPNHKKALFIRASSYMKKGLYYEAIKDCNKLLAIDKVNVGAYYTRGCAYEKLGEIDKGIEDFTIVLELDPNHVNAAFARGACQNRKGDFAKAIEDYHMALEKDGEKQQQQQVGKKMGLRRSSSKMDKTESLLVTPGASETNQSRMELIQGMGQNAEFRNKLYQSPKGVLNDKDPHGNFGSFAGRVEEDLLNPLEQKAKYLEMDNSLLINNDPLRNSHNSFHLTNSTTRSITRTNNDDTISCSSEVSYQEGSFKVNNRKTSEFAFENASDRMKHPDGQYSSNPKSRAEWYHAQGFEARKRGDFPLAIEYYSKALEILPSHFKALFNRGFAFDKVGNYDLAIDDYTQAIKLDPKNAYAYYNRGISLDRKNEYDEAIKNFTIAISLESNKADFHHNRGFAYRKKKNFNQAILDYTAAIQIDGNHFKAFYNRAFCHDKVGNLEHAESDYLQALQIQPRNINALHHLGTLMEKVGGDKLYTALGYFNQVLTLDPAYAPSYNGRGLVYDKLLKYDEAYQDFKKAMDLDPRNPVFIHNRACCLRNMGRLKEAIEDFSAALEFDDKNPIIYSNIGLVYRKLENFEKAIENYTKELFFSNENQKTYNNRAYCFAKLGKYKEAVCDYTKSLSLDPKNLHALHNRGICYERLGLYRNAIEDFTTVIGINKTNANAYFNRGCCYDSIGELDLAIADYSVALEIDSKASQSNNTSTLNNLSQRLN